MTGKSAGTTIAGRLYVKAASSEGNLPCAYRVISRRLWVSNHVVPLVNRYLFGFDTDDRLISSFLQEFKIGQYRHEVSE